jgi:hypothetical protein
MGKLNVDTLVKSKALLDLQDAASTVADIDQELYTNILRRKYALSNSQFYGNYLVLGADNLSREVGDPNFPILIIYDTTGDSLTLVEQIFLPEGLLGEELPNSFSEISFSPNQKRPLINIGIERFNQEGTVFTRENTLYFLNEFGTLTKLNTFDPYAIFNLNPNTTFIGQSAFSGDSCFIVFTSRPSLQSESENPRPELLIARITADSNVEEAFRILLPEINEEIIINPGLIPIFYRNPCKKHVYNIIFLGVTQTGTVGVIFIYEINVRTGAVELVQQETLNQIPFTASLHPCKDRLIVGTNQAAVDGVSSDINSQDPLTGGAPCPDNELRLYAIDNCACPDKHDRIGHNCERRRGEYLDFIAGYDAEASVQSTQWSHDGKRLAVTTTPYNGLPLVLINEELPVLLRPPGNVITFTYNYECENLDLEDTSPTSPTPFTLAWNPCKSELAVGGGPTPVQNNVLLFNVKVVCQKNRRHRKCPKKHHTKCKDIRIEKWVDCNKCKCDDSF